MSAGLGSGATYVGPDALPYRSAKAGEVHRVAARRKSQREKRVGIRWVLRKGRGRWDNRRVLGRVIVIVGRKEEDSKCERLMSVRSRGRAGWFFLRPGGILARKKSGCACRREPHETRRTRERGGHCRHRAGARPARFPARGDADFPSQARAR